MYAGDIGYLSKLIKVTGVKFRLTPADYLYSWHNAPSRQFIVNLDADVEVEVSSGERRVIKQGEVFFVEDVTGRVFVYLLPLQIQVNCSCRKLIIYCQLQCIIYHPCSTGKGHYSRAVADQPRHSLFLPVGDEFKAEDC